MSQLVGFARVLVPDGVRIQFGFQQALDDKGTVADAWAEILGDLASLAPTLTKQSKS